MAASEEDKMPEDELIGQMTYAFFLHLQVFFRPQISVLLNSLPGL